MQQYGHFFITHWDLFLAFFVVSAMLVHNLLGARLRGYTEVAPLEAVQIMNHDTAILVDVREDSEFREGHIQNAIHIPLGSFAGRVGELESHKANPVIVGCRSGHRSARACAILRKQGFEKVYNLRGGIMAWESANLPVSRGGKRKKK